MTRLGGRREAKACLPPNLIASFIIRRFYFINPFINPHVSKSANDISSLLSMSCPFPTPIHQEKP